MGIWDIVNCKERMENFELSRATLKYSGDFLLYLILLLVHVWVVVVVIIVISVRGSPEKGIQHSTLCYSYAEGKIQLSNLLLIIKKVRIVIVIVIACKTNISFPHRFHNISVLHSLH